MIGWLRRWRRDGADLEYIELPRPAVPLAGSLPAGGTWQLERAVTGPEWKCPECTHAGERHDVWGLRTVYVITCSVPGCHGLGPELVPGTGGAR